MRYTGCFGNGMRWAFLAVFGVVVLPSCGRVAPEVSPCGDVVASTTLAPVCNLRWGNGDYVFGGAVLTDTADETLVVSHFGKAMLFAGRTIEPAPATTKSTLLAMLGPDCQPRWTLDRSGDGVLERRRRRRR